jgi:hypothetical protein
MGSELPLRSRAEVTTRFAKAYVKAGKAGKGRILDQVVGVTGWSRDNARRRLTAAARRPPGAGRQVAVVARRPRAPKFSFDARKVLQRVWAAPGGQCAASTWPPRWRSSWTRWSGTAGWCPAGTATAGGRGGAAGHAGGLDRPLPQAGQGERPGQGRGRDQALAAAAVLGQDPQGRRRGRGRAGVLRGRHRGALRASPDGRVRADAEPDGRAHRLGVHPHRAQQRPRPHPRRFEGRGRADPVRRHRPWGSATAASSSTPR